MNFRFRIFIAYIVLYLGYIPALWVTDMLSRIGLELGSNVAARCAGFIVNLTGEEL